MIQSQPRPGSKSKCKLKSRFRVQKGLTTYKRERVAGIYGRHLNDIEELEPLCEKKGYRRSWFVYVVKLSRKYDRYHKRRILEGLTRKAIGCREYFPAIHLEPFYREMFGFRRGDYPVTEATADRTFAIPFYNNLRENDIAVICRELKRQLQRCR